MVKKESRYCSGQNSLFTILNNSNTKQDMESIPYGGIKFTAINPITRQHITVGTLYPTGVFLKVVAEKSKLRVLDAYGIEADTIDELQKCNCKEIRLAVKDTGKVYGIDFATFRKLALCRTFGRSSCQYYLPMKYWKELGKTEQISLVQVDDV